MHVLVLHDELPADARADELDTLAQANAIADALHANGHEVTLASCGLDLRALVRMLEELRPDVTFDLVENVGRSGRIAHLPAQALEHAGVAFTGGSAQALYLSNSKLLSKLILAAHDLPTPLWRSAAQLAAGVAGDGPWLVKAVWEHGSLGIDDSSVLDTNDAAALAQGLHARRAALCGEGFVERYVHGREFNVALLEVDGAPRCLPVGEITFAASFAGRPHLVGYRAKWDEASADYRDTVRSLEFAASDDALLEGLRRLALATWDAFSMSGYARVDFRVDQAGAPWIIDVNVNPCLTPDAGFAAMLARGGIEYGAALEHILQAARRRARVDGDA